MKGREGETNKFLALISDLQWYTKTSIHVSTHNPCYQYPICLSLINFARKQTENIIVLEEIHKGRK